MPTKKSQREFIREQYCLMSPWQRKHCIKLLNKRVLHLLRNARLSGLRKLGAYWACDHEIQTQSLLNTMAKKGCAIYIPAFNLSSYDKSMRFCKVRRPFKRNCAKASRGRIVGRTANVRQLNCLLIPMMAFDDKRKRLGRGGGYYDRALSFIRTQTRPLCLGVAWNFQKLDNVCSEVHDIPMDAICTPQRNY